MINQPAGPPAQPGLDRDGQPPARPGSTAPDGRRAGGARDRLRSRRRARSRQERRAETTAVPARRPRPRAHLRLRAARGDRSDTRGRTGGRVRPNGRGRPTTSRPRRCAALTQRHPHAARLLVLLAAFVCAACGLVYELELVALGGYLLGDSVTQTSVVLSVMVFAMGLGSLAAKHVAHRPATSFALVECALALVGGLSVLALYGCWAWLGRCEAAMIGLTCLIGVLIGAEIPLLMTLIQQIRREDAGRAAADLFAADYVGALFGGLAFPFLLLPGFGQAAGALLTGAINALAGAAVVLWLFRDEPGPRTRLLLWAGCGAVLATLALAAACTGAIERAAQNALYGGPARQAVQSRYGEIVLTGSDGPEPRTERTAQAAQAALAPRPRLPEQRLAPGTGPLRLYLAGRLAVCGADEYRYHEALVHPALAGGADTRVLLLGGGDGLALREVLRHRSVSSVLVVTLDPALPALARTDPALAALSEHSFADPRVRLVIADPLAWLRHRGDGDSDSDDRFDAVLVDLPAPERAVHREYRAAEFFGLAAARLAPGGRLAVPAAMPGGAAAAGNVWAVEAALRAAALRPVPFPVAGSGPACDPAGSGDLAAVLLAARDARPQFALAADAPPPRSLTVPGLTAAAGALAAQRPTQLPPAGTLLDPR